MFDRDEEVLSAIYAAMCSVPSEQALAQKHRLTLARYLDFYRGSLVVGLEIGGELAGGMFFQEPGAVHLGILQRFRARWVRWLRPMLEIGFERYGPRLKAEVNALNLRAQEFMERGGCIRGRATALLVEYEVSKERMNYGVNNQ